MEPSRETRKVKVDIFVPTSRCSCDWEGFMNEVFEVLMPRIKEIEFETRDSESEPAKARLLPIHCAVVGDEVFTSARTLKARLPGLIRPAGEPAGRAATRA